ncbi:MAG: FUSC family protein [Clostridiales bacterium]|nr:FUSC family protein [Clostridiales bacterium]
MLICLIIYHLRGYRGAAMPTESMVTAIICMQPRVSRSRSYAISRLVGSALGAFLGLLLLLFLEWFPFLTEDAPLLYPLMAAGVLLALYSSVLLGKPDTAALSAIVFLAVVVHYPEIDRPINDALLRMVDVFIGTMVAILVNVARLPRKKHSERVFFIRARDLVEDRYTKIPPSVLFRLGSLCSDGAAICLLSEHAPAFFTIQMNSVGLNVPMIVMDGAGIYDVAENRYLYTCPLPREDSRTLLELLDRLGRSCYIYTVHGNANYIYHRGRITENERMVYERMRRSPYRSYLDGGDIRLEEIVYFKVIDGDEEVEAFARELRTLLPASRYRTVIREQGGAPGVSALYIYAADASTLRAERTLLNLLEKDGRKREYREIFLPDGYRTERDALRILKRVGSAYEPVAFF